MKSVVILVIDTDPEDDDPRGWDWPVLLDMRPEKVQVVMVDELYTGETDGD